jgi:hypothetical protein
MEKTQSPNTQNGLMKISEDHLIRFLVFFAVLWFRTYRFQKAGRALLAASSLRLRTFSKSPRRIFLDPPDKLRPLEDAASLVTFARDIFTGLTFFKVHPFVRRVIEEMEAEANTLLSFYLLSVHPKEEPCG